MKAEKTIQICGKDIDMLYCAAAETGYERLANRSSAVFVPTVLERDENGKPTNIEPPQALGDDYIKLAISAIIAAYAKKQMDAPVTADDIMYDATPKDVELLITTVIELRNLWYQVPNTVKPETDEKPDDGKNA